MNLLLASEKLITSTSKDEWAKLTACDIILFTSGDNPTYCKNLASWKGAIFKDIYHFKDYAYNDVIIPEILRLNKSIKLNNIIAMTEADILRVAVVKQKLNMSGMAVEDAKF